MSAQEMEAIYLSLKESGDLEKMFPGMTGNWDKDKKTFAAEYNNNERILEDLEIDDFDDDFDPYF